MSLILNKFNVSLNLSFFSASKVNQKYSQLRTNFHLQMLSKMLPTHLTNGKAYDSNPYLCDIDQHIQWCQEKLVSFKI